MSGHDRHAAPGERSPHANAADPPMTRESLTSAWERAIRAERFNFVPGPDATTRELLDAFAATPMALVCAQVRARKRATEHVPLTCFFTRATLARLEGLGADVGSTVQGLVEVAVEAYLQAISEPSDDLTDPRD